MAEEVLGQKNNLEFFNFDKRRNVLAPMTTQQVLSFIQSRIAETRAAGGDIVGLLKHPEIAFSLQVLDGKHINTEQAPANTAAEDNKNTVTEQLYMATDTNTNKGESPATLQIFNFLALFFKL